MFTFGISSTISLNLSTLLLSSYHIMKVYCHPFLLIISFSCMCYMTMLWKWPHITFRPSTRSLLALLIAFSMPWCCWCAIILPRDAMPLVGLQCVIVAFFGANVLISFWPFDDILLAPCLTRPPLQLLHDHGMKTQTDPPLAFWPSRWPKQMSSFTTCLCKQLSNLMGFGPGFRFWR